jgi:predicted RNA-binding protein with PIN domain
VIIIIDGYNLLKQIFPHVKGRLDPQRDMFVRQLGCYKHIKLGDISEIIVVFDAGPFSHATREIKHGIVVMFAGQKSTADDWIIEYVQKHRNEELLVVTNDRKIVLSSEHCNATTLSSNDFYQILQRVLFEERFEDSLPKVKLSSDIKKFEDADYFDKNLDGLGQCDDKTLDMLMEQSSFNLQNKDESIPYSPKKERKPYELSKKEKRIYSKLKKLY